MVTGIEMGWAKLGLPENTAADVARAMVICATSNQGGGAGADAPSHDNAALPFIGKIVWVAGGQCYEIEDRIQALEPQWLGEENARVLAKGQAFLADSTTSWDAEKLEAAEPKTSGAQVETKEVFPAAAVKMDGP